MEQIILNLSRNGNFQNLIDRNQVIFNEIQRRLRAIFQNGINVITVNSSKTTFEATLENAGIRVSKLSNHYKLLEWNTFYAAFIPFCHPNPYGELESFEAKKGNAKKGGRLGEVGGLALDTIEGSMALLKYQTQTGRTVYRKTTQISGLLNMAKIAENNHGKMILNNDFRDSAKYIWGQIN